MTTPRTPGARRFVERVLQHHLDTRCGAQRSRRIESAILEGFAGRDLGTKPPVRPFAVDVAKTAWNLLVHVVPDHGGALNAIIRQPNMASVARRPACRPDGNGANRRESIPRC